MKPCCGKGYIECEEICEEEGLCRLKYQEEIAIPRLNKELDKAFPPKIVPQEQSGEKKCPTS